MTLRRLVADAQRRLRAARLHYGHGTDNARDEAAFLVLRGLGLDFDADLDRPVGAAEARRVAALLERRIATRMPAAYLLKEAWLAGRSFYVDERVIVPRSHIAGLLSGRLRPWLRRSPRRILDLCTGSGCLAILAALAFPRAEVHGADLSPAALAVARINLRRHRLERRVRLVRSSLFAALEGERYDLIVSNPPYVPAAEMRRLPGEYRHEPPMALAGGRDGLQLVARIVREHARFLDPNGLLVCEVGGNRRALERRYPRLPLAWPQDEVFILEISRTAAPRRRRATRPAAR